MKCPFCGSEETQVKDSRPSEENTVIRRRRECPKCEARFTTFERVQLREITVTKSDGARQPYSRDKLLRSLNLCMQKRPVESAVLEGVASDITRYLETSGENEFTSKEIGSLTMERVAMLDPVAYVRYASVYKDFRGVDDFNNFLDELKAKYKKATDDN